MSIYSILSKACLWKAHNTGTKTIPYYYHRVTLNLDVWKSTNSLCSGKLPNSRLFWKVFEDWSSGIPFLQWWTLLPVLFSLVSVVIVIRCTYFLLIISSFVSSVSISEFFEIEGHIIHHIYINKICLYRNKGNTAGLRFFDWKLIHGC